MAAPLNNHRPPKWADRFLAWFCRDELLEEIKGDLHEFYALELGDKKPWQAKLYYWYHVFHFLRPFAIKSRRQHSNTLTMYRTYFKFAWRHALKHKGNTLLHVLSLGLGIACSIFIFIYLKGELSYDRFHQDVDRIHRVVIDFVDSEQRRIPDATTPPALAPNLVKDFAEVASAVRLFPNWGNKFLLGASPEKKFHEEDFIRTDPGFFDIFTFPALHGDPAKALEKRDQIILTRSAATKYFGKTNVVGENLMQYLSDTTIVYQIGAVLEDVPLHSHFHFDFLAAISFENLEQNWGWYNYYTYIKLAPSAEIASLEPKLQPYFESQLEERDIYNIIYSQPLTAIHLRSHLKWELEPNGDIANVYILALLALFVLIMSCLNYLNLKIAEVSKKYREVGVRKVFGANKGSLIGQFMVETLLISFLALLFASLLSQGLFIQLREVLGRDISIIDPENLVAFLWIGLVVVLVGVLAGLYPAIRLSSFKVALAVKGLFNSSGKSTNGLRRGLLVVQFAISTFMIFCTIGVYQQLQYVKQVDKGFSPEQVLVIENIQHIPYQRSLKEELLKIASVSEAGLSNGVIGGLNWTSSLGYPDAFTMNWVTVDPGFLGTMGLALKAGRNFSPDRETDKSGLNFIVNETGLQQLGLTYEDVGKRVKMTEPQDSTRDGMGTILGVVEDFHFTDFKSSIKPFAFFYRERPQNYLNLKLSTNDLAETLQSIDQVWSQFSNQAPLDYFFLDQNFAELYAKENRLSNVLLFLTVLAILIAVLGMFAIANITIKDRTKEIAIRKVLGASVSGVTFLITKHFLLLVLLANLIAIPIAYYGLQQWLDGFAYRISLGMVLFLLTVFSTLLVAWATVGLQSFRAAISNPMKSLKEE